jgi:glycosyltransferase involved in cell wall biosynthesis
MTSPAPTVSVLMPVFNAGKFLREAVESILAQSFCDFEFLIFDDGSTDESRALLERYAGDDVRVKLTLGDHRGYTSCLRQGVDAARGRYVARMDADDVSLPNRLARQVQFMDQHPECAAVGGQAVRIDADGDALCLERVPETHERIDERHMRRFGGQIMHPNVMMRTQTLRQIGNYRLEFEPAEDLDLFLRLAEVGRLANLGEVTLKYRMHLKSVTHTRIEQQRERSWAAVEDAHRRRGRVLDCRQLKEIKPAPSAADIAWSWVRAAYKSGNFATARKYALRFIWRDPFRTHSWWLFIGSMLGPLAPPLHRLLKGHQSEAPDE